MKLSGRYAIQLLAITLLLILLVACSCFIGRRSALPGQPHLMLWAWEEPADLRYIDIGKTGIAFLAGTVTWKDDSLLVKPRFQTLHYPAGSYRMAVVRIEPDQKQAASYRKIQVGLLSKAVLRLATAQKIDSLQIDFDARADERNFYLALLRELRNKMPAGMPLSITALSSWCLKDAWISVLPCDEVVPMFFSMGMERTETINLLAGKNGLARLPMQESIGLSVAEPDVLRYLSRLTDHVYLFSPQGWNNKQAIKWVKAFESGHNHWQELSGARVY